MTPQVSILILNWNGWRDTIECLESLYQINYSHYNLIVIDNNSEDESIDKIRGYGKGEIKVESKFFKYKRENKPIKIFEYSKEETENPNIGNELLKNQFLDLHSNEKLLLLKNDKNYGFAEGNNIGIRLVLNGLKSDYILLLNNDTVVHENFLDRMIAVAENDAKIGILGPKIYYYDFQGRTDIVANLGGKIDLSQYPGYYDLTEKNGLKNYSGIIECEWVSGAALLMKSRDLPLKTLNKDLFFGCEDIDLALRLKEFGYQAVVVSDSHIWHKEGVSRKKRSSDAIRRAFMEIKSNLTFLKAHNKHYYLFLPLYLLQIAKLYFMVIIRR